MHPEYIKAGLRAQFGSLSEFERLKNLPAGSARDVLRGKSVSRTAEAMAEALGVPFTAISPNQKRVKSRVEADHTSTNVDSHCLNAGVR